MKRLLVCASIVLSCATTPPPHAHIDPSIWFHGSAEQAFAAAKAQSKPIFLYWGAVWCPPCNQIKSEVFTTPEFAALMRSVVPVYLDGDTEGAQQWAEKLHVSGYPTMLVLDPAGHEVMRIGEFVDLQEFTTAFTSALTTARPLTETIDRALKGEATEQDWNILAYVGWEQSSIDLLTRLKLVKAAPQKYVAPRAILAAKLLESAAPTPRDDDTGRAIRAESKTLLGAIFFFDAAVLAARSTLEESSADIVSWLYPEPSAERTALIEKWNKAADWLSTEPALSVGDRMMAAVPRMELWQLEHAGQPLPPALLEEIHAAVAQADGEATTPYSRHAVISNASQILTEAGDVAGAKALLVKELSTTDTPWYYESELAETELKAGHQEAALDWSAKARESAKGNATRLQWIALDLKMNARVNRPDKWKRCAALLQELFDTALALPDGLSGRNATRAGSALQAMKTAHPGTADVEVLQPVYAGFMQRCTKAASSASCYAFVGAKEGTTLAELLK